VNFACTIAQARPFDRELDLAKADLSSLSAMPAYIARMAAWMLGTSDLLGRQHQQLLDEAFGDLPSKSSMDNWAWASMPTSGRACSGWLTEGSTSWIACALPTMRGLLVDCFMVVESFSGSMVGVGAPPL
jgi:hypothetical protein